MSDYIRVFRNQAEYEAFVEAERQAKLRHHAKESLERNAKAALRRAHAKEAAYNRSFFDSISFEEKERRVQRILAREDVRDLQNRAKEFAKTVRVLSGGLPSLGRG